MDLFWTYLKTDLKLSFKQFPKLLAVYMLIPLFFSYILAISFSSTFIPDESSDPIQLSIDQEDSGIYSQMLIKALKSEGLSHYLEITDESISSFHLTIEREYSQNLIDNLLSLESKENSSLTEESILKDILQQWQFSLVNQEYLGQEIAVSDNSAATLSIVAAIQEANSISSNQIFEQERYESNLALNSFQFTSVSGLNFILIMSMASVASMVTPQFKGLRKRLAMVPLTAMKRVIFEVLSNSLLFCIILAIYILFWRLINPTTFIGNPIFYLNWIIVYSLFFQSLNVLMHYVIPDKWVQPVYQISVIAYMIFATLPFDRIISGRLGQLFDENIFRKLFNQPFYDYFIYGDALTHLPIAFGLIVSTVIITYITIIIQQRRELNRK